MKRINISPTKIEFIFILNFFKFLNNNVDIVLKLIQFQVLKLFFKINAKYFLFLAFQIVFF
jgi:hypothetical protein